MSRGLSALALLLLTSCSSEMTSTTDSPSAVAEPQPTPVDPVGIRPIPAIPAGLRGCWQTDGPADPDEPGAPHRLIVTATTIQLIFSGAEEGVATADFVERVGAALIEGRFSAPDSTGRKTVATSLSLLDPDTLRRAEGDAGSDHYYRCP